MAFVKIRGRSSPTRYASVVDGLHGLLQREYVVPQRLFRPFEVALHLAHQSVERRRQRQRRRGRRRYVIEIIFPEGGDLTNVDHPPLPVE